MTFKDLQKLIESQPNPKHTKAFQRLRDKPFWRFSIPSTDNQSSPEHIAAFQRPYKSKKKRERNSILC